MKIIVAIALVALCAMGVSVGKSFVVSVSAATIDHQQKMKAAIGE